MLLTRMFIVAAILLCGTAAIQSQTTSLHSVAWLSGDWRSVTSNGLVEERWTAPCRRRDGGPEPRFARREEDAQLQAYLRLELRGTDIVYIASPNAKKVAEFKTRGGDCRSSRLRRR